LLVRNILEDACAVGQRIYLLFPASLRVNLLSQQIRALELVDSLRREPWAAGLTSIAVVGGGASGVTAAAALKNAGLRDELMVTIIESRDQLMPLQSGCHDKVLAPRIIDWPRSGADDSDAPLPFLGWKKAAAAEVAIEMLTQFERFGVDRLVGATVTGLNERGHGVDVTFEQDGATITRPFDLVIVAAGFGLEAAPAGILSATPSYWRVNPEQAPALQGGAPKSILVSGLGDGGLTDFVLFACPGLNHSRLCEQILSSPDVAALKSDIDSIEARIWASPPTVMDIADEYGRLNLDTAARNLILPWLARDTRFVLLTKGTNFLQRGTAPLNRLAAMLVRRAMQLEDRGTSVRVVTNAEHLADRGDESVWSAGGTEEAAKFDVVVVRHGDTSRKTWSFGNAAVDAKVDELRLKRAGMTERPRTPDLSVDLVAAFEARSLAVRATRVRLTRFGDRVIWHGDLPVDEIGRLWRVPSAPIHIEIGFDPIGDDAALDFALLRMLGHAEPPAELAGPHAATWIAKMNTVRGKAGDRMRLGVARIGTIAVDRNELAAEADQLAARIETSLDKGLIDLINTRMRGVRAIPPECPVRLHPDVMVGVADGWGAWFSEARGLSSGNLRWVLRLLGGLLGRHGQPDPWTSIRVGPKCVEDELMTAIIYHLAMRMLLDGFDGLGQKPTGNVLRHDTAASNMSAAHFCGSRWYRDESGEALEINDWEKNWPGDAFAPSCLVLTARTSDFLPPISLTGRNTTTGMVAQPWERVPVVFASPELRTALRTGAAAATSALQKALAQSLPIL
jgi:hypothetical protein